MTSIPITCLRVETIMTKFKLHRLQRKLSKINIMLTALDLEPKTDHMTEYLTLVVERAILIDQLYGKDNK